MTLLTENLLVGLIALAMVPIIAWRILRGLREGRVPVYRAYVSRDEEPGHFRFIFAIHVITLILVVIIAADLLLGLDLVGRR